MMTPINHFPRLCRTCGPPLRRAVSFLGSCLQRLSANHFAPSRIPHRGRDAVKRVGETAANPWSYLPRGGRTTVSGAAGKPPEKAPRPFSGHRNGRTCRLIGQQQREPPGFLGSLPPFILGCIEAPPQIPDLVGKLRAFAVPFRCHG